MPLTDIVITQKQDRIEGNPDMEYRKPSDRAHAKGPNVDQMKWKAGARADGGDKGLCNNYLEGGRGGNGWNMPEK